MQYLVDFVFYPVYFCEENYKKDNYEKKFEQ